MSDTSESEMRPILREIRNLNQEYPIGLIAIGDVAVYIHTLSDGRGGFAESTHHFDFYLSKENLGSLRDREEFTANPKSHKQQIVRQAIEMNIYVEHQHRLAVPYENLDRYSTIIDGIRVAAKEHLLALKIDAAIDRFRSAKGDKDAKDLVNLIVSLDQPRNGLLQPMLDEERLDFLRSLGRGSEPFQTMSGGNSHQSSILWKTYKEHLARIDRGLALPEPIVAASSVAVTKEVDEPKRTRASSPNLNILPARVGNVYPGPVTTIQELCMQAAIPYKYVGGDLPFVGLSRDGGNLRATNERNHRILVVDETQFTAQTPAERALRILEVVAHSFHEYAARECVRGLFRYSPMVEFPEPRDTSSMTAAKRKAKQRSRAIKTGMCYACLSTPARQHRSTCADCATYHADAQRTRRGTRN